MSKFQNKALFKVRVDGIIQEIEKGMQLDRYKTHDIEIVIDRLLIDDTAEKRLEESIKTAMYHGEETLMILPHDTENNTVSPRYFSRNLMCPTTGISYPKPEPNSFSFNSPKGACDHCNGLGKVHEVNMDKIIPNINISIKNGGLAPLGDQKNTWIFKQFRYIAEKYDFSLSDPISKIYLKKL